MLKKKRTELVPMSDEQIAEAKQKHEDKLIKQARIKRKEELNKALQDIFEKDYERG